VERLVPAVSKARRSTASASSLRRAAVSGGTSLSSEAVSSVIVGANRISSTQWAAADVELVVLQLRAHDPLHGGSHLRRVPPLDADVPEGEHGLAVARVLRQVLTQDGDRDLEVAALPRLARLPGGRRGCWRPGARRHARRAGPRHARVAGAVFFMARVAAAPEGEPGDVPEGGRGRRPARSGPRPPARRPTRAPAPRRGRRRSPGGRRPSRRRGPSRRDGAPAARPRSRRPPPRAHQGSGEVAVGEDHGAPATMPQAR
jgi:hypothetical protein